MRFHLRSVIVTMSVALLLVSVAHAQGPRRGPGGRGPIGRGMGDHRKPDTLKVGDVAPDFTLKSPDGKTEQTLSSFKGKKPVALVFGSYTWPPFRRQVGALDAMYEKYNDKVEFFMVYITEAHPSDGWQVGMNTREGIVFEQPKTLDERVKIATTMCTKLKIKLPPLVDALDNKVNKAYNAAPDRLYLIGVDGKIAFQGARGPWGFKAGELKEAIEKELGGKQ